jgi:DNA-binding response OmpR family regulator
MNALKNMDLPKNDYSKRLSPGRKPKIRQRQLAQAAPSPIKPLALPAYRILLVDDEPDLHRLNVEILTEAGYVVETADDGVEALAALAGGSYDLLVTDNVMPNLSGAQLLQKLHAARKSVPTIMMTGTLPRPEIRGLPWFQTVCIMLKPYILSDLLAAVKKTLRSTSASLPIA